MVTDELCGYCEGRCWEHSSLAVPKHNCAARGCIEEVDLLLWRTAATKSHGEFQDPLRIQFDIQDYMGRDINTTCGRPVYLEDSAQLKLTEVNRPERKLLKTLLLMWQGRTRITKWGGGWGCENSGKSGEMLTVSLISRSRIPTKELNSLCPGHTVCTRQVNILLAEMEAEKKVTVLLLLFVIFCHQIKKQIEIYQNKSGKKCTSVRKHAI